jgi:N-dimethylarginine dimethylaminohydrolase
MCAQAVFLMVDPTHYEVSYRINPWMQPDAWQRDAARHRQGAQQAYASLCSTLRRTGCEVISVPGAPGVPDMVFTANAAIVMAGRALMARFRHPERQPEEAAYLKVFENLQAQGRLHEVGQLPPGCHQEGAGDCLWDAGRELFWAGHGPRSSLQAVPLIRDFFDAEVVPLELTSEYCYHLDVCFCPLSGGEILYFPPALSEAARRQLARRVPRDLLIEASEEDLGHFSVNAVNLGRLLIMNHTTDRLRQTLADRGYQVVELDLSPFTMSGGSACCLTLRLDRGPTVPGPA